MARIKSLVCITLFSILALGWSLSASATPHIASVLDRPDALVNLDLEQTLFTDPVDSASSFIREFVATQLSGYTPSVETFAGPYRLFSTDASTKLADTGSTGMMLACLGLMVLMARKRLTL